VLVDVGLLDDPADEEVAQEVALVLVLDRRHCALPGDQQRGHDGHALERMHVDLGDRAVEPQAHQPGEVGTAGGNPQRTDLTAAQHLPVLLDALDPDAPGRVDEPGARQCVASTGRQRRSTFATVGRGERDLDVEDVGRLGGDLPQVTALQDQVRQRRVQSVDPGQCPAGLLVDLHANVPRHRRAVNT
jgi:hypothetical protein